MAKTKQVKDSWTFGARATSKDKSEFTNWFSNGSVKDPLLPNQLFTETGSHTVNTAHSMYGDLLKSFCKKFTCVDYSTYDKRALAMQYRYVHNETYHEGDEFKLRAYLGKRWDS